MTKLVIFDWYGTLQDGDIGLFPDSLRTLQELEEKKISVGLISKTSNREKAEREVMSAGLAKFFNPNNSFFTFEKNPNQFLYLMHHYSTDNRNTLVVGDRAAENREIHIGNQLRCSTYWIQRGLHAQELPNENVGQPTRIISTVSEILKYI
ncbi:MAG: HAD family hydrolase [archaeon]